MTAALKRSASDTIPHVVTRFSELQTAFADHAFHEYRVERVSEHQLNLNRPEGAIAVLNAPFWLDPNLHEAIQDLLKNSDMTIVCVGSATELEGTPEVLRDNHRLQWLCIPVGLEQLRLAVANIKNLQVLLKTSNLEREAVEEANRNVKYVMSISRLLNGERDIPRLLELILRKAREVCQADAGSIYTVVRPNDSDNIRDATLKFRVAQNDSVHRDYSEFSMPVTENSIVGNVAIHERTINIPDLYELSPRAEDNPYRVVHDRSFDARTGYASHSMLTVPIYDISHSLIGVVQLINRKNTKHAGPLKSREDFLTRVIPFSDIDQEYVEIVAQQAGIALENANMQLEIQELFNGFVRASVTAIEQRDPTTSGHSHRVKNLCIGLAQTVNRTPNGKYGSLHFNANHMQELEYAALLHDFGKLGVRENVLVKARKLYPWQMEILEQRFELIESQLEIEYLQKLVDFLQHPDRFPMGISPSSFVFERDHKKRELRDFLSFIMKANEPTILEQGGFERLKDIAGMRFKKLNGTEAPFLLVDELEALSVSRGSLTRSEFAEIQSHVTHTYNFLYNIPWGRRLHNVPQIAAKHHEKLDGSGYPNGASDSEIPVQSRIMTIADIYDALTASDRPYKKAVPAQKALDILEIDVRAGRLDSDLFHLFVEAKVYEQDHGGR